MRLYLIIQTLLSPVENGAQFPFIDESNVKNAYTNDVILLGSIFDYVRTQLKEGK